MSAPPSEYLTPFKNLGAALGVNQDMNTLASAQQDPSLPSADNSPPLSQQPSTSATAIARDAANAAKAKKFVKKLPLVSTPARTSPIPFNGDSPQSPAAKATPSQIPIPIIPTENTFTNLDTNSSQQTKDVFNSPAPMANSATGTPAKPSPAAPATTRSTADHLQKAALATKTTPLELCTKYREVFKDFSRMGPCAAADQILKYHATRKLTLVSSTHEDAITLTKLKAIAKFIDFETEAPFPIYFTIKYLDGNE